MKNRQIVYRIIWGSAALLLMSLSFTGSLDKLGNSYTQDAFNRALITYGIARAINGVISVAQGTEVAVQPAGFGVNFTPGQILDPINDLVERFSWVMLAATASLGIQQIFIKISSSIVVSIALAILLALVLINKIILNHPSNTIKTILYRLLLIVIFIRFAVPLTAIASEMMYRHFLSDQYTSSTESLEQTKVAIGEINNRASESGVDTNNKSILDKAADFVNSATSSVDIGKKIDAYKEAVEQASHNTINLIAIFIVYTAFFPLLFLWALILLLKGIGFQGLISFKD